MKLNEAAQINSINDEYIVLIDTTGNPLRINKSNLAEAVRTAMSEATTDKNGLKSAKEVRMEKFMATTVSRVVYEWKTKTSLSTTLLISLTAAGDRAATLFFMSLNISMNIVRAPIIILNRIGGIGVPSTPRFKIWLDENSGNFKIILERTEYTPSIFVKILQTNLPSTDAVPLSVANQDEVDAATYIDVAQ